MECQYCNEGFIYAVLRTISGDFYVCEKCFEEAVEHERTRYKHVPGSVVIPKGLVRHGTQSNPN